MRDQDYLTLKERLEVLFGIRGAEGDRAARKKELDSLRNRVGRLQRDSGWRIPTLLNGWVDYGGSYGPPRYRRLDSGLVVVEGLVKSGTAGATIFTLPEGFRPRVTHILHPQDSAGSAGARLDITPVGDVNHNAGSTGWMYICCSFYADQ